MDELRRIDLNLMLSLHALLTEQHVTRAAHRLHKSQPAVSHALAHLRQVFNDPLLIRRGSRLELTAMALQLQRPLEQALQQLNALLDTGGFDPVSEQREFRLAMSDYGAQIVLPPLMRRLRQQAPGIRLAVSQASREAMLAQLSDGEIDLAFGVFSEMAASLQAQTLFDEHLICIADQASLSGGQPPGLDEWLQRPHVLLAMRPGGESEVDKALSQHGLHRQIVLSLPHWSAAAQVLEGTDLILTVSSRSAEHLRDQARLVFFQPPLPIPPVLFQQVWHRRRHTDPAHAWLRQQVMQCCQT
ncbi:LysR family transcriptional regulator [Alcaligenes sp. Lyrl_28]|uniref:LysR family transcriptional regulator n=1 Tax=Alcaligenes sp. Lyrl_28 TaxID=3110924 RepID=UPI002B764B7E|nr:LysR family transcriptional regulator [Alcaligenes sp.]